MIHFARIPDQAFNTLVALSLCDLRSSVVMGPDAKYGQQPPKLLCSVIPKNALFLLIEMLEHYHESEKWEFFIGKYHWVTLYYALSEYAVGWNEADDEMKFHQCCGEIDVERLVRVFFPKDFRPPNLGDARMGERNVFGFSEDELNEIRVLEASFGSGEIVDHDDVVEDFHARDRMTKREPLTASRLVEMTTLARKAIDLGAPYPPEEWEI